MKTYSIGDIHGKLDMLERALAWIDHDSNGEDASVVFLGDYIDRGPDSCGVIARLMAGPTSGNHRWTCLMGNHEDMLVAAMEDNDEALKVWWNNGGPECLASYVRGGREGIPNDHIEWMKRLPVLVVANGRAFVHAALDPTHALSEQRRSNMMWGRYESKVYVATPVRDDDGTPLLVVHGHTPHMGYPIYVPGRVINLDAGSCFGGHLSVAAWDEGATHPRVAQFSDDMSFELDLSEVRQLHWDERLGWKVR